MASTRINIVAAGDVLINRAAPESALQRLAPLLRNADLSMCNLEGVLGDGVEPLPGRGGIAIAPAANASALAVFDVVSLANNHSLDAGHAGLFSTLDALNDTGVRSVGAGQSRREAWAPLVMARRETTIACIAASAILRVGYDAGVSSPGIAALRSTDFYASRFPGAIVPGALPRIHTEVNDNDWRLLEQAVRDARDQAEWVVLSLHWGDHTAPFGLTQLERQTARRLSELDVDAVVGHHHHALRGIEFIGRMPVLYGLGHLVFDQPGYAERFAREQPECVGLSDDALEARFGRYAHFPRNSGFLFDETSRWTAVAHLSLSREEGASVSLVPLRLGAQASPEMIARGSESWRDFLSFIAQCQHVVGPVTRIEDRGIEIDGLAVLSVVCDAD
ncbi:CapA family protein [Paraburkholderia aspalathi]|uniref:CapA family protein n=1 Tax=Paraburkholderia aspalathi TaxID=1324617 RepID=UPI0038B7A779